MLKKGQVLEAEHSEYKGKGYYVFVGRIIRIENGKVILYNDRNTPGYRHKAEDIAEVERWLEEGRNGYAYRIRPKPQSSWKDYDQPEITLSP